MVRTARSIEEEARVRQVSGTGTDVFLAQPELRDVLEGRTIEELLEWASEGVRRVLVVGLEDRGSIALSLANSGLFVTVVDSDETLIEKAAGLAEEENCSLRMNFYASEYMKKEFSSSGFDMVVFFSTLSRYNEPDVVVRKAARELRAGGKLFVRLRVRPTPEFVSKVRSRFPLADRLLRKAAGVAASVPGFGRYLTTPETRAFIESVSGVLKIEKQRHEHILAPTLGWAASKLPLKGMRVAAARAVNALSKAESSVLNGREGDLASYLVIFAVKELGLGKTFRV